MEDKRAVKRHNLYSSVWVRDGGSGIELGQVYDISVHGAQVVGNEPFEKGRTYKLQLELPEEILGKKEALLDALCVWASRDLNPSYFKAGFRFVDRGTFIESIVGLIHEYTL